MFDTHFHLDPEDNAEEIYKNARSAGVEYMTLIGCDPESCDRAINTAAKFENMFFSAGVHPLYVKDFQGETSDFDHYYKNENNVAVGEIGLDFYYDKDEAIQKRQITIFESFLNKSRELQKPAIIHSREAFPETLSCINNTLEGKQDFILHCYTGDENWVSGFLDAGGYISYSGIVTFKNADSLRKSLEKVPLDRILIETDSPYLAPVPMRGKRNQPAYVVHVRDKIAQLLSMDLEELTKLTTQNAKRVFKLS
ncbi:TatD protein [Lentisphaera araneosa HTCC2155]|uniref:TatD protein n=1 Tax=Lentisphaera araneosa HTCC2155 TaxID=313628 RepID=A6DNR9_9BACT|nr:TatD family hydrolase [Lentisphaera araneosa]EDM26728.1 TatD protein [Lentisphaera araneosa HTCC2155]